MIKKRSYKRPSTFLLIGICSALIVSAVLGTRGVLGFLIGMIAAYVILER